MASTQSSNRYFEVVDIGHGKLQKNSRVTRKWETFIGFLSTENNNDFYHNCNNLLKPGSYTAGQGIPCLYGY
jgi:hypothetical protein